LKRLYICRFKDDEWISAIVANSHKKAKKEFFKLYRGTTGNFYDEEWMDIRVRLSKSDADISKFPLGEIQSEWGFKNGIYSEI
jgi:hypothetical protein